MSWASSWRLAVGTLTVLPVRPPATVDRRVAGDAMLVAPLAVLPVAAVAAGLGWLAGRAGWPTLLAGLVVITTVTLGTRALHLDGLADTVDGLGSGRDRERALQIMRRGDIGPMGVLALVLVVGSQAVAASSLTAGWRDPVLLAVAVCASRGALVIGCRRGVPAARTDGLGALVAGSVGAPAALLAGSVGAAAVVGAALLAARPWWAAALGVAAAAGISYAVVGTARRRFGGITGDVLGATVELALTALLLGLVTA